MQAWIVIVAAIGYLLLLFVIASLADRRRRDRPRSPRPVLYALSLAIYCTSWTYFGSVGLASTNGLDFLGIYLGPLLMVTVGFPILRHVMRVSQAERITSVADFLASRYGKSPTAGAIAALIAVVGTVPYIALQLKAIATSLATMLPIANESALSLPGGVDTALVIAALLAAFTVLFGTRHADATEHQDGLILAVATESVVKLVAFVTLGIFVTFFLFDGPENLVQAAAASSVVDASLESWFSPTTFFVYTLLSFCAFILLPRQFHVAVVENNAPEEAEPSRWMFPLYLILINLFVVPVALAGLVTFGGGVNADVFVLALPLQADQGWLSLLVFIGGLSAATAMVIVACVALAIMLSNNIVLPLLLNNVGNRHRIGTGMAPVLLRIRRLAIFGVILLSYLYYRATADSAALASIGLLAFAAIAQFAPAFFGGMFWQRATARGAIWGMVAGIATWFYTLLLPTLLASGETIMTSGPFGVSWLHPQGLFGVSLDPLQHGVLFSLLFNLVAYIGLSLSRAPSAAERMQAAAYSYFENSRQVQQRAGIAPVTIAQVQATVANYLGYERSVRAFSHHFADKGIDPDQRDLADDRLLHFAEQLLASAIGAASSRLVMSLMLQRQDQATDKTRQLLDDASQALQQNRDILQTAIDQVEQGISVFDAHFRLSSWNRQFRGLLDLQESYGRAGIPLSRIADAISENCTWQPSEGDDAAKRLLVVDRPWQITVRTSQRIVEVLTKEMPGGGYVVSWSDITERVRAADALRTYNVTLERRVQERTSALTEVNRDLEQAREQAEAANIGKTRFLAAVGHDILQPLNAARLYASTLKERSQDADARLLSTNIDQSLESVEDILSAVLAISRLDSGVLSPNFSDVAVADLFKRLDVEFRPMADRKKLDLHIESSNFVVRSDASLLRRLLQNLVSNAIRYTSAGSVHLGARIEGKELIFTVRDTGPGIAPEEQDIVFQEFRRLEAGREAADGLGLGLSIVRRLADVLEHELKMDSTLGKGTVFSLHAPLAAGIIAEPMAAGQREGAQKGSMNGLRVFVIDNETMILDGMRRLLEQWGCEVGCFEKSHDLLAAVEDAPPAIVLADYHLDKEIGLDVVDRVRAISDRDLPAVLITADRSAAVRNAAIAADVITLQKPVKPGALRAILARQKKASGKRVAGAQSRTEKTPAE